MKKIQEVKPVETEAPKEVPKLEVASQPLETKEPDIIRVKKTGGRRWWLSGVGLACVVVALLLVFNIDFTKNQVGAFFVCGILLGGGFCIYYGLKKPEENLTYVTASGKPKKVIDKLHPPNSLNIYPDKIDFEFEAKPLGAPWQCENDNQFYYIHIKTSDGKTNALALPDDNKDDRYYDPTEYGNVVTMPLNKKYFSWVPSTGKLISMGIMAAIILIEIIGLIAIGGKGG